MKKLFQAIVFLAMGLLLIACGQSVTATPSPIPSPSPTATPTLVPTQTATATIESTARPEYVPPTLIPTIDPPLIPDLLKNAFSMRTIEGVNGYQIRQITGWDYGFGGNRHGGWGWVDSNHLILYPVIGQAPGMSAMADNLAPQPVVINLNTGISWLPNTVIAWSGDLGILATFESDVISTYTFDGEFIAQYSGNRFGISPRGTKILLTDDKLIDLRTNKKISLAWPKNDDEEPISSGLSWSDDETRVYRCCYYYADTSTGRSYRFEVTDLQTTDGSHARSTMLPFVNGQWVRNDTYFLVRWSYIDDGDIRYLPMFDPAKKIIYDIREMAGIPEDFTSLHTPVSPDGNYVWIEGWNESYLVHLTTFETQHYTYTNPYSYTDIDWSLDSKFVWFEIYDPDTKSTEVQILSIADMNMNSLPVIYQSESGHLWHPGDNMVVYPAKDKNALIFLDASTISFRELPFPDQDSRYKISNLAWNPNGDKLIFITENSTLWQVDYPSLENLEQIIDLPNTIDGAQFSPDGKSITFLSGSDIYIVDTTK